MRLFVAIPLASSIRQMLGAVLARLEPLGWPVRWLQAEDLHLTLKFLGEVESGALAEVSAAMVEASRGTPALDLAISGLGTFPSNNRPRIIWAGVQAEPALELLADHLERRFEPLGFPVEGRAFHPHITLGRVRERQRLPAGAASELSGDEPEGAFTATEVVLFESTPGASGMIHTPLHTAALGSLSGRQP